LNECETGTDAVVSESDSRVDEIFSDALELPAPDRPAFLVRACGADTELIRKVEALLDAHAAAAGFLREAPDLPDRIAETELIGTRVGPFEIVRHVGSGGMGAVFEARRADEQFEQTVAVKLIKPGMDSAEIVRRFRNERQLLAHLQHPNIASLLDGGVTEEGRPYLVMEFVMGEPLTDFCRRKNLSVREQLHIFLQILDAVMAAHRRLVVHRDLKPGNILVQSSDAKPQVKLLDFGIARVLNPESALYSGDVTQPQLQMISPAYASPEQIRGEFVSTASDIYSLGVILYELLCGERPYALNSGSLSVVQRANFQPKIVRPSLRAPSKRADRLRGDLDWIVMKALQIDPDLRYSTADEFRADIERFLKDEPVLAGRPTIWYRIEKFVKRHRVATAAGAVAVLALLVGVVASSWGWMVARRANHAAQIEAATTRAINQFLVDVFEAPDPWRAAEFSGQCDITVVDALDGAGKRLAAGFEDQPLLRAELQLTIGRTYRNLGYLERSEPLLVSAADTFQRNAGDEDERTIEAVGELARLLSQQGNDERARVLFEKRLAHYRNRYGPDHASTLLARRDVIAAAAAMGQVREATTDYQDLLLRQRRLLGDDHLATLKTMHSLGVLYSEMDRLDEAEPLLEEAFNRRRSRLGETHPSTIGTMTVLAQVYRQTGRVPQAESLLRQALDVHRSVLGEMHPTTLTSKSTLGMLLFSKGELGEAVSMFEELVGECREVHGSEHPATISALANLATLRMRSGDHRQALNLMEEAVALSRKSAGADHPKTLHAMHTLGMILINLEEYARAREVLTQTVDSRKQVLGAENSLTLSSMNNLAHVLGNLDQWTDAVALHRTVLSAREKHLGRDHRDTLISVIGLGNALVEDERFEQAKDLYDAWRPQAREAGSRGDWLGAQFDANFGKCHMRLGELERAENLLRKACESLESLLGASHIRARRARALLVQTLDELGKHEDAAQLRSFDGK
jgi:serine/threonine protein kinase/tetratricopeptide (TPR) repeat protein